MNEFYHVTVCKFYAEIHTVVIKRIISVFVRYVAETNHLIDTAEKPCRGRYHCKVVIQFFYLPSFTVFRIPFVIFTVYRAVAYVIAVAVGVLTVHIRFAVRRH